MGRLPWTSVNSACIDTLLSLTSLCRIAQYRAPTAGSGDQRGLFISTKSYLQIQRLNFPHKMSLLNSHHIDQKEEVSCSTEHV